MSAKGNFVKLHDEQVTHGMRFTKPSIAQEVCTVNFATDEFLTHGSSILLSSCMPSECDWMKPGRSDYALTLQIDIYFLQMILFQI